MAAGAGDIPPLGPAPAIRVEEFGEPSVLKVGETTLPEPGPTQVAVAIRAIGVNPVDTYIRSGAYAAKPELPYTPGHDCGGVVTAVGSEIDHVKPGDRVYTTRSVTGAYATIGLFEGLHVNKVPDSISFEQAAALGTPYSTAYRALFQRAHAKPGQWVLVHGASGAVGIASVQLAHWAGLKVIGTAGTDAGKEALTKLGVSVVLNHHTDDISTAVLAATSGQGVPTIIEMLANVNLGKDLELLARGGTVAIVGSRGEVTINPRALMAREAAAVGVMLGGATPSDWSEIYSAVGAAMGAGIVSPQVGATFSGLESAPEAHVEVIARASGLPGKVVITL